MTYYNVYYITISYGWCDSYNNKTKRLNLFTYLMQKYKVKVMCYTHYDTKVYIYNSLSC